MVGGRPRLAHDGVLIAHELVDARRRRAEASSRRRGPRLRDLEIADELRAARDARRELLAELRLPWAPRSACWDAARMRSVLRTTCSTPRVCWDVDDTICCDVSAIRSMAIVACFDPFACSCVARAMRRTISVDSRLDDRIFFSAFSASLETCTPRSMVSTPRPTAPIAFVDSVCTALMRSLMDRVLAPARSASSLISSATTAKPLPCSPAWAAMMAAFSARRFVCSATSSMTPTMAPIWPIFSPRLWMTARASSELSLMRKISSVVFRMASAPFSASSATSSESRAVRSAWRWTSSMDEFISLIEVLVSSAD